MSIVLSVKTNAYLPETTLSSTGRKPEPSIDETCFITPLPFPVPMISSPNEVATTMREVEIDFHSGLRSPKTTSALRAVSGVSNNMDSTIMFFLIFYLLVKQVMWHNEYQLPVS